MAPADEIETARRLVTNIGRGGLDPASYADEMTAWSPLSGSMSRDEYLPKLAMVPQLFETPLEVTIDAITAQPGRVALQCRSKGVLITGRTYTNDYHFLVEFDESGRISHVREYFDMVRVQEMLLPAIAQWRRSAAG